MFCHLEVWLNIKVSLRWFEFELVAVVRRTVGEIEKEADLQ